MRADLLSSWGVDRDHTGGSRWRAKCEELYNYLRRDMQDARDQRAALYPKNHAQHVQRTVPVVWRMARELATLYRREPARDFGGVPDSVGRRIEAIYAGAQVNRCLGTAHEHVVALNNATIWVWPTGFGGVRLICPPAHDQEVQLKDFVSQDERDVETWWLRLPVQRDAYTGLMAYAIARITATEAVWESGPDDLAGKGVWRDDGVNPLGFIPVVMARGTDPAPGEWWAPVPEDLLDAQRAINHDQTDIGTIARLQGFSQLVLTGFNATDEIKTGPESTLATDNPDASADFINASPDLDGYREQNDSYVRNVIAHNGLNPATFMKSAGITALAKQIELIDREAERERHKIEFRRVEQRLYMVIAGWVNQLRGLEVLPPTDVAIEYRQTVAPADPLHSAQATEMEIKLGLTSRARERAKRDGIGMVEARARVIADLAEEAALVAMHAEAEPMDDDEIPPLRVVGDA